MSAVLSVKNLTVQLIRNRQLLVNDISFEIAPGEVLALVGESGSGKSLTALSLMRLLPDAIAIQSGSVEISRQQVFQLPETRMNHVRGKRIAMIFQEPQSSLNPVQTIGEQIYEVFALHQQLSRKVAAAKIQDLLREVGIPDPETRIHWYPHQLSGGQKQRVMIAMALACEPDLLLADEPTTALDVTIQKQILDLLKTLCKKRHLAVLLITHDMGVVAEMADRVAVMRQGSLLEQNTCANFFRAPQHEYSQQLIHALPDTQHFLDAVTTAPVLSVSNMSVGFAMRRGILQRTATYTKAVDDVSFTLYQGQTLALVGESGCGKTTIGKALVALNHLQSGSVIYHEGATEHNISGLAAANFHPWRKKIQMVFQDPYSSMNPRMTVRQIIEEGMTALRVEADPVKRNLDIAILMERVGLEAEHLDRYIHEFSGGQRQRVAIARALAVKPAVLICDEPTSALDVSIRGQILALLKKLQDEEGLSYLFITHDLSIVPQIAHHVAVMRNGIIVEAGVTRTVMTNPSHDYTKTLLAAAPKILSKMLPEIFPKIKTSSRDGDL